MSAHTVRARFHSMLALAGLAVAALGVTSLNHAPEAQAIEAQSTTSNATATWGFKESFRKYVKGPITKGGWGFSGNVSDVPAAFTWTKGEGEADPTNNTADVTFKGSVNFTGHAGQLNMTMNNLHLKISPESSMLYLDLSTKPLGSDTVKSAANVPFAKMGDTKWDGTTFTASSVTLTSEAVKAFEGFYEPGTALDPITLVTPLDEKVEAPEPTASVAPTATPTATATPLPTETAVPTVTPTPSAMPTKAPKPTKAPAPKPKPVPAPAPKPAPEPAPVPTKAPEACVARVASGQMVWGIKTSFRNYIDGGIAKGHWDLNGVSDNGAQFVWRGTGAFNPKTTRGIVPLPGSIHFTGHKGLLDMTFSNMRVVINSASTGSLVSDVVSADMSGKKGYYPNSTLATLSFSLQESGDMISVSGASASLTSVGAKAFADFYQPGTAMDPVSFNFQLGSQVECSKSLGGSAAGFIGGGSASGGSGSLASTGAEPVPGFFLLIGVLALLGGAAGVAANRRRVNTLG